MPPNVQLGEKESVNVFVEIETGRILGFAPEHCDLLQAPQHIRYTCNTLKHVSEIEKWFGKYRAQMERDAEESTQLRIEREAPFRKALRSSLNARGNQINRLNRDLNTAIMNLADQRYDQINKAKMKPVVHGMAEATESNKQVGDVALESAAFRSVGDNRASGGVVPREIAKLEYDRTH